MNSHQKKVYRLLNKYLYECKFKSQAHGQAEKINRYRSKISTWTQNSLGLVVGIFGLSIWGADDCNSSDQQGLIITSIVLSFLASMIGLTRGVWRYTEKVSLHHQTSGNYADVSSDIELFLSKDPDSLRDEIEQFVELCHERLDIYDASACPISNEFIEKAKTKVPYPKNGLFDPLKYGLKKKETEVVSPHYRREKRKEKKETELKEMIIED